MATNITQSRFEFALKELGSGNWERFEKLASTFLAGDFDEIRTTASPSGDRGRDSQLYNTGDPTVMLQYSVTKDWRGKIRNTVERIRGEFLSASALVYVTNQVIGSEADDLVAEMRRQQRILLDIRDRHWFSERLHKDRMREIAAEELAMEVVNPLLAQSGLIERRPSPLTNAELRAAVVHLQLQLADDDQDKGLTRTAFEAIVRSVLRETEPDKRMRREQVKQAVRAILPSHNPAEVDQHTDRALNKLSRSASHRLVQHWAAADEFCLPNDERVRLAEHLVVADAHEQALKAELQELASAFAASLGYESKLTDGEMDDLVGRGRHVLEAFLLGRGEAFALGVQTGHYEDLDFQDLRDLILKDLSANKSRSAIPVAEVLESVVREVVVRPGEATQRYLRGLIDSYTLLAFLRATPDVQSVVQKMFSDGEIWLDTNVLLPLFAEQLFDDEVRQYTHLLTAATEAGLQLYATEGVVEELDRQMSMALVFNDHQKGWEGTVPFLYGVYVSAGESPAGFRSWIDQFRGGERPEDDLKDYLEEEFSIRVASLSEEAGRATDEVRHAVEEIWTEVHEKRRDVLRINEILMKRLALHDAENYLGVMVRRKGGSDHFGFTSWWLSLDSAAFRVEQKLKTRISGSVPRSPVMSPDFLSSYLAFGPARRKMSKKRELTLPIALGRGMMEFLSPDVVAEAVKARQRAQGLPERQARRFVRDAMDRARRRVGNLARTGLTSVGEQAKLAGESRRQ
jgi:hypothetical protein